MRSAMPDDHGEVMRDQQKAHAVLADQGLQQVEDLRLRGDVERGGRLVGDQQARVQRDGHGDADALALAARQLVRVARRAEIGTGRPGPAVARGVARRAARRAVDRQRLGHLVADGLHRVERGHRLLEDHPDLACHAQAHQSASDRPSSSWPSSRSGPLPLRPAAGAP
jgi:hypothetical protein